MMTALDEGVGRILDTLKELELDENTIVFLSSDNGPHKEGGHMPDYFNSNGDFRGYKRDLYEGGIRCPLLVRWPGKIKPGSTSDHLSAHWDVLPTFCELAGTKAPVIIDGISFVPTLLGKRQQAHKYLYWEFFEGGGKRAMRMGNWKAVQNNLNKGGPNASIELYDLSKDSAERNNLAAKNPEIVSHAKHIFKEAHTPSQIWKFKWER
jgi:arylsulfatase A-like enzyme